MSTRMADSAAHRLAPVPPGGPIGGHSVAVPRGTAGTGPCVFTVRSAEGELASAVRAVPLAEVPSGVVAIGEDLVGEWDIDVDQAEWTLTRVDPVPIGTLTLELPTEREPDASAREIAGAGLVDELLWVPADGSDCWLTVGGVPHRVRNIDVGGRTGIVAVITGNTAIELYASAVRAGVDIVILADCSGSMQIDDLPAGGESRRLTPGGARWLTRMEALQQALHDLLRMRLQISGRISRLALLEFNHQTRQRFPRDGGMAQLDAGSTSHQIDEFRHGVALLRPFGTTDIGNALHEAANLLYQHGHAGNDKLIVLVSDGADWSPKGEKGSGEVVYAVQEPVSLMAHLHRDMGIRLHAIGIGTAELFHRRGGWEPNAASVPNHTLLAELVKVGGGDPATVGGLDVLEDYFSGLAAGMVHRIRDRLTERRAPGPLPDHTRAALARLTASAGQDHGALRTELRGQIIELVGRCSNESQRALGGPIWDVQRVDALCQRHMIASTSTDDALTRFLATAARTLRPNALADDIGEVTAAWCGTLDRLESMSRHQGPVAPRFGLEFSVRADTPAEVHLHVMDRLRDELTQLHVRLGKLPDHEPVSPRQANPVSSAGFFYQD
ncbi:vWA domain-containing protein [Amycolatopsis nalaikhensis]|uniref:VWA domain-containing protein n=1 Tax=Amycolatopsis nalaikhensis TaxID=715472 RepID=A0ABY8XQ36_9PSEU|nr:vWA domain-containing protein [Amycolatopsis sp. 2-2]WIV57787.1 VWA domain-containing protein [Amycolatopsis sp. 2-2]